MSKKKMHPDFKKGLEEAARTADKRYAAMEQDQEFIKSSKELGELSTQRKLTK